MTNEEKDKKMEEKEVGEKLTTSAGGFGTGRQGEEMAPINFAAPKYEDDAQLWFRQLEARFIAAKITAQTTRYYIAFGNLPALLLKPILASLEEPGNSKTAYDDLKKAVLSREELSATQRVDQVLKDIVMGDRKPSDFFAQLKETAGTSFSEEAVYHIFLLRIPENIKTTLIVLKNEPLKYRLEIANELFVAHGSKSHVPTQIAAVGGSEDRFETMKRELLEEVKKLLPRSDRRARFRDRRTRSSSRGRTPGREPTRERPKKEYEFCWHHFKFGDKASRCSADYCKYEKRPKN